MQTIAYVSSWLPLIGKGFVPCELVRPLHFSESSERRENFSPRANLSILKSKAHRVGDPGTDETLKDHLVNRVHIVHSCRIWSGCGRHKRHQQPACGVPGTQPSATGVLEADGAATDAFRTGWLHFRDGRAAALGIRARTALHTAR